MKLFVLSASLINRVRLFFALNFLSFSEAKKRVKVETEKLFNDLLILEFIEMIGRTVERLLMGLMGMLILIGAAHLIGVIFSGIVLVVAKIALLFPGGLSKDGVSLVGMSRQYFIAISSNGYQIGLLVISTLSFISWWISTHQANKEKDEIKKSAKRY